MGLPLDEMSNIKSDSWKINICRSFKGNELNTTLAPCNMTYSDAENFVNLKLTEDIPFIDIGSIGNLNSNILDFKMDLLSAKNTDVVLSLESPKNVLPYQFEKQISLPQEKAETVTAKTDNLPPDNVLKINLTLKGGTELYKAALKYKEQTPVVVSYIYTDIDKQILNTVFSSSKKLSTGDVFIFKMIDQYGKIVLEEKIHPISQNLIFTVPVNIGKLAPGEYKFVLNCADKNGNVLLDHWEMFQKPSEVPSWKDTKAGISDKVPAPWTHVAATVNQFSCWGRIYSFGGSGILSSLKSQTMEMLSAPIHLTIDGVSMMETNCELISSNETTAKYHLSSKSNSLKVNADVTAEFDGFIWIDLTYAPISDSAEISSMTLDIPLDRKYITYFDDCQSITSKTDLTENKNRVIANNFMKMPACWIGGDDVGLMVGAGNLKGWYVKNKRKSMEIIPGEKTVTLRLNLVDTNLKLTSSRKIGFYLDATPTKPRNQKVKSLRADKNATVWSGYWNKYYDYYNPEYFDIERLDNLKKQIHPLFHYTSAHGTSPYSPDWNYYGKEWHSSPPQLGAYCVGCDVSKRTLRDRNTFTYACLDCKSFFDFKLATLAEAINNPDTGIENLYIDLAWPKLCGNETHGCAWTDEFGDKHSTFDIIGTREYYKRLYNVLKKKNPDAVITMHIVRTRTPADSYADLLVMGESYDHEVSRKESYYDVLNPTTVRIAYASRGKEQEVWLIPQFTRGFILFRPQRLATWKADQPEAMRAVKHFMGYMTVHNISYWYGTDTIKPSKLLYDAQDWLGWPENINFFPYWKNAENPVRLLSPEPERLMVSSFTKGKRLLVALLNDTDKTVNAELFMKEKNNIAGKNAFSEDATVYEIKDNSLRVPMAPRDFKLLMFE